MAKFPSTEVGGAVRAFGLLNDAILGLAKMVQAPFRQNVESQREAGEAVGEYAIVNIAAGSEVAGQRRRTLPHFAPATRILVVAIGERLAAREPKTLDENRGNALRQIETKAANHAKPEGHHV